jgi:hypothetical protein
MKAIIPLFLILALSASGAVSQTAGPQTANPAPQIDTVTVEAPKALDEKAVHDFIKSYAHPASPVIGKLAQWSKHAPLCPIAVGLSPAFDIFVSERIRTVAGTVGAPVQTKVLCTPNMSVLFTSHPQAVLDAIRTSRKDLLGFYYRDKEEAITKVNHPIQAWYATATRDWFGGLKVDTGDTVYSGAFPAGGSLLDGFSSEMTTVTVVVDDTKIVGLQLGAVADYIAMLALSQTQAFETCQPLASITNLMTPGCDAGMKSDVLSQNDVAYLTALYRMAPDTVSLGQKSDIAHQMETALGAH